MHTVELMDGMPRWMVFSFFFFSQSIVQTLHHAFAGHGEEGYCHFQDGASLRALRLRAVSLHDSHCPLQHKGLDCH